MFSTSDTIVAIATPAGRGGIGVVRLSGPDAKHTAEALVGGGLTLEARRATFARLPDPVAEAGRLLDQVVLTWFAAPHSYTGEDVVEISGHGSPLLLRRIVECAMAEGTRLAEPGEFTLRAYLNGRMDLIQAEAVADLIDAVTPLQARVAMDQLDGTLTEAIRRIDRALFDLSAGLEASLDFPEEGFHFLSPGDLRAELGRIRDEIAALILEGRAGRVVREGRTVVIAGRPNAGKSSLFNALVGAARAIVTEIPGTTRDLLTERVDIDGLAITLVDTAGLREAAADAIEAEGVERAIRARDAAALTLMVIDGSQPLTDTDRAIVDEPSRHDRGDAIVAFSKADLPAQCDVAELAVDPVRVVRVSALTGEGLGELRRAIARALTDKDQDGWHDAPAISNVRHLALLEEARSCLEAADRAIDAGATEELLIVDIAAARQKLEELTGRRTPDDLLEHIFSRFCIGK